MSTSWKIQESILVLTLDGRCGDGVRAAISEAMDSTQFKSGISLLFDARLVIDNPTSDGLRACARWLSTLTGISGRAAIVIGPKLHHYGLARMVATLAGFHGMTVDVFYDADRAERWLSDGATP